MQKHTHRIELTTLAVAVCVSICLPSISPFKERERERDSQSDITCTCVPLLPPPLNYFSAYLLLFLTLSVHGFSFSLVCTSVYFPLVLFRSLCFFLSLFLSQPYHPPQKHSIQFDSILLLSFAYSTIILLYHSIHVFSYSYSY